MLKSKIYPNCKHRLGRSPRVKTEDEKLKNADVAERQTRWFQVPVKRFVWVQIPSSAPDRNNTNLSHEGFVFFFARDFFGIKIKREEI